MDAIAVLPTAAAAPAPSSPSRRRAPVWLRLWSWLRVPRRLITAIGLTFAPVWALTVLSFAVPGLGDLALPWLVFGPVAVATLVLAPLLPRTALIVGAVAAGTQLLAPVPFLTSDRYGDVYVAWAATTVFLALIARRAPRLREAIWPIATTAFFIAAVRALAHAEPRGMLSGLLGGIGLDAFARIPTGLSRWLRFDVPLHLGLNAVAMALVFGAATWLGCSVRAGIRAAETRRQTPLPARTDPVVAERLRAKPEDGRSPRQWRAAEGHPSAAVQQPAIAADLLSILSDRERAVFFDCARGLSNAEIAQAEFVSLSTVKSQVSTVLRKLHLSSRVQLVVFAYEHGVCAPAADPSASLTHPPQTEVGC